MLSSQRPVPEAKIQCGNCKSKNSFVNCLQEKMLPEPYAHLFEGVLVCPDCGTETHCYYLSPLLREKRTEMLSIIKKLSLNLTQATFEEIKKIREDYKILFDAEQEIYKHLTIKAITQDDRPN